jgi:transposase
VSRFIDEADRYQGALLPGTIDEYVSEENPVRAVDAFVGALDMTSLGFQGADPKAGGRPGYHPATMLKIYVYGYLNRIQSSRRLEQEARRNLELMWLVGRLTPDFKTIADFRHDNGPAIRQVCIHFVRLCRQLGLFERALVAIDGSKFKAVNNRDKNSTSHKLDARRQQLEASVDRYLAELDRADREPALVSEERSERLKERIARLRAQMKVFDSIEQQLAESRDEQVSLTDPDARSMATSGRGTGIVGYNVQAFGTLKAWMGATHFLTKTLPRVRTEMSLPVLAYNLKRVMQMIGVKALIQAIRPS